MSSSQIQRQKWNGGCQGLEGEEGGISAERAVSVLQDEEFCGQVVVMVIE